jgi:hypothetical protein
MLYTSVKHPGKTSDIKVENCMKLISMISIALVSSLCVSANAEAADFRARTQLRQHSIINGVGTSEVGVLKRLPGAGRTSARRALMRNLQVAGLIGPVLRTEYSTGKETEIGADWHLSIYGDGTKMKFRKGPSSAAGTPALERRTVSPENRLSNEDLELLARDFIADTLYDIVGSTADNELVALNTVHELNETIQENGTVLEKTIGGSIIAFGRRIDGVHVVGPGSKIAVLFTADGEIEGFDVDWPKYQRTGRKLRTLAGKAQIERTNAILTRESASQPLEFSSVECGYVDFGTRRRAEFSDLIQAGCAVAYRSTIVGAKAGESTSSAKVIYVPAGEVPEADPTWLELVRVQTLGDQCAVEQPLTIGLDIPATAQEP